MGCISQTLRRFNIQPAACQHLTSQLSVVSFQSHHYRHLDSHLLDSANDAFCDQVATHDAAKNIDQHGFHIFVRQNNFKCLGDPLFGSATANVQKVGRRTAMKLDDIHRPHCQTGAVYHAADTAIQRDIVELPLRSVRFTLVFLAAPEDVELAKERKAPLVELTYNWDDEEYLGGRNFGHLAYRVDDIYETCQRLMDMGVTINRPPRDGHMAFVRSPDGISVELLQDGSLPPAEPWASMPNTGAW